MGLVRFYGFINNCKDLSGLFRSLIRSVCKAFVSLFCPLLVLLVFARNGQTVYDRLTKSVVVHVSHLYRPVYSSEIPPNT